MSRALDDLAEPFRAWAFEFLARATEARVPLLIVDTLRTPAEQADNLARGVSWTTNSKHLPDANGKARAIDVVPFAVYQLDGPDKLAWNASHAVWAQLVTLAKQVAARRGITIRCGFDWLTTPDPGHYEWLAQ